jgi:hypothetical protein
MARIDLSLSTSGTPLTMIAQLHDGLRYVVAAVADRYDVQAINAMRKNSE